MELRSFAKTSLALTSLLACTPDPIKIDLPTVDGARSVALVREYRNEVLALLTDLDARPESFTLDLEPEFDLSLTALYFAEELATLDLKPGVHGAARTDEKHALGLPPDIEIQQSSVKNGEPQGWRPIELSSDAAETVRNFKVSGSSPCLRFTPKRVQLRDANWVRAVVPLGAGEYAVFAHRVYESPEPPPPPPATPKSLVFRVTPDSGSAVATATLAVYSEDGVVDRQGRSWVSLTRHFNDGGLCVFPPADGSEPVDRLSEAGIQEVDSDLSLAASRPAPTPAQCLIHLSASPETSSATLDAMDIDGDILRFWGDHWTVLNDHAGQIEVGLQGGFVFDGEAIEFVTSDGMAMFRAEKGEREDRVRTALDDLPPDEANEILSIERIPDQGTMIGTYGGYLLVRRGERFEFFTDVGVVRGSIGAILPFGRGFLVGGRQGLFRQWDPRLGFCEASAAPGPIDVAELVASEDGIIVYGKADRNQITEFGRVDITFMTYDPEDRVE